MTEAALNGPFGRVPLGATLLTIGRSPDNQLMLADASVSSHQAEIRSQGQGDYALVDLGSSNGTFLNGQRLAPHVPSPLHAGDTLRVGDTRFTYEVAGASESEPTVYAGSRQEGWPASPPMVATGYGAYPSSPPPPPPPPTPASLEPAIYPQGVPYYGTPVPPPAQPKKRRGLWILLGAIIGALVLIGLVSFGVIAYANRSTPTKTLTAFCTALKGGDYQTAYNLLSSGLQSKFGSEAQFAAGYATNSGLGKITNCAVSASDDAAGTGAISDTFSSGSTVIDDYILVSENGGWKINSQQPRSTPTLTLHTYCEAINRGDYQSAYSLLSSASQSQQSEAQFAANFGPGQLTSCAVVQASDAAGTGTITYSSSTNYQLTADYTLVKENNTWKFDHQQLRSTPALTLLNYCGALKGGDYQTAYNQLASSLASQITEAQFATAFSANKVTNCTVSNVSDSAGTGTISFTYSNGGSRINDFTLIDENGAWKIKSGQARS